MAQQRPPFYQPTQMTNAELIALLNQQQNQGAVTPTPKEDTSAPTESLADILDSITSSPSRIEPYDIQSQITTPLNKPGVDVSGTIGPKLSEPGMASAVGSNAMGMAGSLGGAGALAGIAGGLALGAKGVKDLINKKKTKGVEGWGGRATLGIATGGLSEVARAFGLGKKSTKDIQKDKIKELQSKGINVPAFVAFTGKNGKDSFGANEASDFVGKTKDGHWVNNKYAKSHDVKDLVTDDMVGQLVMREKFGNEWDTMGETKRRIITDRVLSSREKGGLKSRKGMFDVDWGKVDLNNLDSPTATPRKIVDPQSVDQRVPGVMSQKTSSPMFTDPNSQDYKKMSKQQKNEYWKNRNSGAQAAAQNGLRKIVG